MAIHASRFGALYDTRLILAEDTGVRYADVTEGAICLSGTDRRSGFWAGEVRRGAMEAWVLHHDRNDAGTIGVSIVFGSTESITDDVTEIGPIFISPGSPDGAVRIPISFEGSAILDTSSLFAALRFRATGEGDERPEVQVRSAFLCRRTS
jgi:hypothetical protein